MRLWQRASLWITNIKPEDYQDGRAYFGSVCNYSYVNCFKSPTPEVYWHYPDGTQNKPDKVSVSLGGQEITVPNLRQQDAGSYECNAKPTWVKEPHDIETSIGATATYICEAKGTPTPQILWFINGVPLDDSKNPTINSNKFVKPNKNNITFVNLDKSDTLVIQCNATNKHGYVFADVYLNVLEEAPQFLEAPHDKKTYEGQSVNMTCRTSGKPDPTITWYRDGDQITGGRYKTLPNGNLHIEIFINTNILDFLGRTRIEFKPSDLEIGAGKDGKFTCSGTTDFAEVEHLHIYWRKDGKTITSNDQRMTQNFQDNSLTISGTIARDSGVYTCVVTNGLDQATASAILTVKDRPDPPLDVVAESCSQTQAVITWTKGAPNNAPIQYFTIQYNTSFAPYLWVFAKKESIPGPVITFSASIKGSNFVKLSWLPPDEMDRNVKGLELGKMQDKDPQINTPYINSTVLNGLVQSQKYRIHIWARTRMGRGEGYFIEVTTEKAGRASDWQQSTDEVAKNWIGIGDLESGTSYQLKLIVTNGKTRAKSGKIKFSTMGIASAYSLGANFGWFIGLILSILIIIGVGVLIWFLRKKALSKPPQERKYNENYITGTKSYIKMLFLLVACLNGDNDFLNLYFKHNDKIQNQCIHMNLNLLVIQMSTIVETLIVPRRDGSAHDSEPPAYLDSEHEYPLFYDMCDVAVRFLTFFQKLGLKLEMNQHKNLKQI
ncbi:hypothetical protein KUTeg_020635 [Tegillarca granosa]|uniref:Uncharacterized protein n=1 Tax=Tegillarca granosa TaxID=220873 RepID=A0ABQ9EEH0_TEGGR|nr:hypothetical protein KUTeg_020635 [Tegillarca granosa]